MMGQCKHEQEQLFYSFRLDDAVPEDHPVREIAAVLDLSWVYAELASYYPKIGRPSIDPVLMIRMLIVGYVLAIRSERALCREVQVNLAYRWFCGLSIEDKVPNHSAFSRARNERFGDSAIFRSVFERVVGACIAAGLVASGGAGVAVQPVSEIVHSVGVDFAGSISPEIQFVQVFSAAVVANSRKIEGSKRLIEFLSSSRASEAIRNSGMEPLARPSAEHRKTD